MSAVVDVLVGIVTVNVLEQDLSDPKSITATVALLALVL
jgi:hypothetical protein